ncbi:MAG TPA: hemerythrin [Clostridiales bacterium]|nr:hemerythrin [Clostridiales bacterium]
MMYASQDLINEHEGILIGLTILEKMADKVEQSGIIEISDIEESVNFFKLFADKCHHGKEEGFMFPAMQKAGLPNEGGPIAQMLLEHDEGRKYITEMSSSIENGALEGNKFIQAAKNYISLMREHIEKENRVLFPFGDKIIPMDEQQQLLEQFEEFEEKVMGKGTHEKLHMLLHNFKVKYLKTPND